MGIFRSGLECSRLSLLVGGLGVGEDARWAPFLVGMALLLYVDDREDRVPDSDSDSDSEFDSKPVDSIVCKHTKYKPHLILDSTHHIDITYTDCLHAFLPQLMIVLHS